MTLSIASRLWYFFRKKFFRAESCAENNVMSDLFGFYIKKGLYIRTTLNVYTTE